MKKKILSLVLAAAMTAGVSMTAFATYNETMENAGAGKPIEMEATLLNGAISMTITDAGGVQVNPYGLVKASTYFDSGKTFKGASIKFVNNSDMAIEVGLKGMLSMKTPYTDATPKLNQVTFASDARTVQTATTKMVYVQALVVDKADDGGYKFLAASDAKYLTNAKGTFVAPLVYAARAVPIDTNPVLAAGSGTAPDPAAGTSSEMVVIISGETSASLTSPWDEEKDLFVVTTTYDLKLAKTPSKFAAKTTTTS